MASFRLHASILTLFSESFKASREQVSKKPRNFQRINFTLKCDDCPSNDRISFQRHITFEVKLNTNYFVYKFSNLGKSLLHNERIDR